MVWGVLFINFVYFCLIIGNRLLGKIEWAWNFNWAHIYYYLKLSKYNLSHEKHLHLCNFPYVCFNHNDDNDESITKIILFGQQSTVWSLVWLAWSNLPYLAIHIFYVPIFDLSMFLYSCKMGVPGKTEGTIFSPIPCEVILTGPERVGGKILQTSCKVVTRIHNPNKH